MLKAILTSVALCFYYWWWNAESPFLMVSNRHSEKTGLPPHFFYYIYRVEWRKGKWQHTLPVQHIFSISAYTGCNYPLMLVCTSITLTCFIKLLLRFSWKGSQSHSPFCWLYYSLPAILVLTLQSGYLSLNVITMWSQNPHIYHYNCASKWWAKWM